LAGCVRRAEGLTRNLPAFSRFLDAAAYSHGELTNYSYIARDCGVESKTVKEYYQILVDTFMGTIVEPFKKRQSRQVISRAPKFYLFDVGVWGALTNVFNERAARIHDQIRIMPYRAFLEALWGDKILA